MRSYGGRLALALVFLVGLSMPAAADKGPGKGSHRKIDDILKRRVDQPGTSRVIVIAKRGADPSRDIRRVGGKIGRKLSLIGGLAVELPNQALRHLAERSEVLSIHADRPIAGEMNRVAITVGARAVQRQMGDGGAGIGVAVIDSGITSWHDDLTYNGTSALVPTVNGQRVAAFVDFVNGRTSPYDDHGHGTHVAGIIAGNGYDSRGTRAGIAPSAHLIGLKVLDGQARGLISNVIAALDWAVRNKAAYNIRVANVSVGAAVTESYWTDPLTRAAKAAVDAGIVVVAAAGNLGKNASGQVQYGGITAPGNAPWVITVGASSHQGTVTRVDDVIALYSSRGPTAKDYLAKPDLVAPGTGTVSLSDPNSTLYASRPEYLLAGSVSTSYKPYLSLTGTSMAAPVVSGTVALMLQANPNLTPNLVKAILQYTAQKYDYNALTQGAGFLNTRDAVHLSGFYATAVAGSTFKMSSAWSRQIIWGNRRLTGGTIRPNTNAWALSTVWGAPRDADGDAISWGSLCGDFCENIVWGTFDLLDSENIVWGTLFDGFGENIVWGTYEDCDLLSLSCENIVWGSLLFHENIVWGTDCGGDDCENVVWGALVDCNLLSGSCENIVWGTAEGVEATLWDALGFAENIVWGTSGEEDNATWGSSGEETPLFDNPTSEPVSYEDSSFDELFTESSAETSDTTGSDSTTDGAAVEGGL